MNQKLHIVKLLILILITTLSCQNSSNSSNEQNCYQVEIVDSLLLKTVTDYINENAIVSDQFVYSITIYQGSQEKIYEISYCEKPKINEKTPSNYAKIEDNYIIVYSGLNNDFKNEMILKDLEEIGLINNEDKSILTICTYEAAIWRLTYDLFNNNKCKIEKFGYVAPPLTFIPVDK